METISTERWVLESAKEGSIAWILFRAKLPFILHLETGSEGDYELWANVLMNREGLKCDDALRQELWT